MAVDLRKIYQIRLANVKNLMEESGLDRTQFGEKIGMTYGLLSQYVGKNPNKKIGDDTAQKIEAAFNKPIGYLDQINPSKISLDNNVDLSQKIPLTGRPVPVISWVAAGSFSTIDTVLKDAEVDEYLPPNSDCGKNGYGLVVTGYSMAPRFEPGDRIYVNPDFQVGDLKTNDLVIIACAGNTEATFKKIIIEGQDKFLEPLNPDWPEKIIKMPEDCRLMGKVVGLHRRF